MNEFFLCFSVIFPFFFIVLHGAIIVQPVSPVNDVFYHCSLLQKFLPTYRKPGLYYAVTLYFIYYKVLTETKLFHYPSLYMCLLLGFEHSCSGGSDNQRGPERIGTVGSCSDLQPD